MNKSKVWCRRHDKNSTVVAKYFKHGSIFTLLECGCKTKIKQESKPVTNPFAPKISESIRPEEQHKKIGEFIRSIEGATVSSPIEDRLSPEPKWEKQTVTREDVGVLDPKTFTITERTEQIREESDEDRSVDKQTIDSSSVGRLSGLLKDKRTEGDSETNSDEEDERHRKEDGTNNHPREKDKSNNRSETLPRGSEERDNLLDFPTFEKSLHGRIPYPYQKEGALFLEKANGRAIILDEMGLGKTVQALIYLKRSESFPCLIFAKPSLLLNWYRECIEWVGVNHLPYIISRGKIDKHYKIYICSMDMAFKKRQELADIGFKLMIIDEVQNIKSLRAKRTVAIRNISKLAHRGGEIEKIIGLTGTPIKNRATEFYSILNIVRPDLFDNQEDYIRKWTRVVWVDGKYKEGGIRNLNGFKEYTKDFVIRRLRKDVLPDLPKVDRQNHFVDMSPQNKAVYAKMHLQLQAFMSSRGENIDFQSYNQILQYITNMRQITALAKVEFAYEYINDFLESSDSKITVFTHHHLAITQLTRALKESEVPFLRYKSKEDIDNIDKFNAAGGERILLASTQSAGEGLNLQYQCHHCLFLERQWNPAIEEQAEGRFTRIGALFDKVTASYLIAIGTIDEWMTELIEMKRVSADVDKEGEYGVSDTVKQIANLLIEKGLPKWKLPKM